MSLKEKSERDRDWKILNYFLIKMKMFKNQKRKAKRNWKELKSCNRSLKKTNLTLNLCKNQSKLRNKSIRSISLLMRLTKWLKNQSQKTNFKLLSNSWRKKLSSNNKTLNLLKACLLRRITNMRNWEGTFIRRLLKEFFGWRTESKNVTLCSRMELWKFSTLRKMNFQPKRYCLRQWRLLSSTTRLMHPKCQRN